MDVPTGQWGIWGWHLVLTWYTEKSKSFRVLRPRKEGTNVGSGESQAWCSGDRGLIEGDTQAVEDLRTWKAG